MIHLTSEIKVIGEAKLKIVNIIFAVAILMILAVVILNLCPGIEAELHRITGLD